MVLADSCVWSLALRRRPGAALSARESTAIAALEEAVRDGRIVLIGPIRQEVLSGIRDSSHFVKLQSALSAFPDFSLSTADYEEAARFYNICRGKGIPTGAVDILLCAAAARNGWTVLTLDQGVQRAIEILHGAGESL
ncbi:MAG: PIN domain-containing protein [Terracidiphilus sp.]